MSEPKVFISYSWDSEDHKAWVRTLADKLQLNGAKVALDQWDTYPGIDLPKYMETSVRDADFVLLICTPLFAEKANGTYGGVGYEKVIVTGEIFEGSSLPKKFVPLVRAGQPKEALPSYLKSKQFIDFRNDSNFDANIEITLRHLHGAPLHSAPPIGPKPSFIAKPPSTTGNSGTVYCGKCGKAPGTYSTCVGGVAHNFLSFTGAVYCGKCGNAPGTYSTCVGGVAHNFLSFTGTVYCGKCGKAPGTYSTCVSGVAHNFLSFTGTVYCGKCGKAPGTYSTCVGSVAHDFKAFK